MNVGGELPQLHDLLPTLDVLGIRLLPCLQVQRKKATGKAEYATVREACCLSSPTSA